ncbi:sugar-binding domain-containing protein, partial [Streptococcus pneumoniae]|uniref:sugar-binding domain-containing protein n=1 Tax=Streptococcus pneumoniae TaxID=1313 RepID=UPI000A417680
EEKAPRIESQASSQEKPLKEDAKAVTNEEMNQMIEDRKVDFVYMDSQVYVNGQLVGHYPNGYNQFSYDITKYLHKDGRENVIAVHAVNKQPSSRWY